MPYIMKTYDREGNLTAIDRNDDIKGGTLRQQFLVSQWASAAICMTLVAATLAGGVFTLTRSSSDARSSTNISISYPQPE